MQRPTRSMVVMISGLSSLACGGLAGGVVCPSTPIAGESCLIDGLTCLDTENADGCGLNGHRCEDGAWRELMTYCNPPPQDLEPEPPSAEPTCPPIRTEGEACATEGLTCMLEGQESACGLNGHRCEGGQWKALMTFCNPPPPPPPPG